MSTYHLLLDKKYMILHCITCQDKKKEAEYQHILGTEVVSGRFFSSLSDKMHILEKQKIAKQRASTLFRLKQKLNYTFQRHRGSMFL